VGIERTTYHVMFDDSDRVLIMIRLRTTGAATDGEIYHPGRGWVPDSRAFDVMLNGQDYHVLAEGRVDELMAAIESGWD
jgi:hypothetical protein